MANGAPPGPFWRRAAIALLVQAAAMTAFWSIRIYYGDQSFRLLQGAFLGVGIIALLIAIGFGVAALRRSRHAAR